MNRFSFLRCTSAVSLTALSGSAARGSETAVSTFDGLWWSGLTPSEKFIAVQGILVGYYGGFFAAAFDSAAEDAKIKERTQSPRFIGGQKFIKVMRDNTAGQDRTLQSIIHELDNYFENHPERSHELVSWHLDCALFSRQHCR